MKIEVGESLGYSYLRHVKQCWLVQANWKPSDQWPREETQASLETMFQSMKERFDCDGAVFKRTGTASQLLRQAEIDVLGVDLWGEVHALEVAFHEAGLNYGGGVDNRLLKKLLRTLVVLTAYHPRRTKLHVYFMSPKVNPSVQCRLDDMFGTLTSEYPEVEWNLLTNEGFTRDVLLPTLEKAGAVSDTSELFVRSAKLLELAGAGRGRSVASASRASDDIAAVIARRGRFQTCPNPTRETPRDDVGWPDDQGSSSEERDQVQPIVRGLMRTLLEDWPDLLDNAEKRNMMDRDYCKNQLGLDLKGLPLLHRIGQGRSISGHYRYWQKQYAGKYYVTNNWWKKDHLANARSLLRFVEDLVRRRQGHEGVPALESHRKTLRQYIERGAGR